MSKQYYCNLYGIKNSAPPTRLPREGAVERSKTEGVNKGARGQGNIEFLSVFCMQKSIQKSNKNCEKQRPNTAY